MFIEVFCIPSVPHPVLIEKKTFLGNVKQHAVYLYNAFSLSERDEDNVLSTWKSAIMYDEAITLKKLAFYMGEEMPEFIINFWRGYEIKHGTIPEDIQRHQRHVEHSIVLDFDPSMSSPALNRIMPVLKKYEEDSGFTIVQVNEENWNQELLGIIRKRYGGKIEDALKAIEKAAEDSIPF